MTGGKGEIGEGPGWKRHVLVIFVYALSTCASQQLEDESSNHSVFAHVQFNCLTLKVVFNPSQKALAENPLWVSSPPKFTGRARPVIMDVGPNPGSSYVPRVLSVDRHPLDHSHDPTGPNDLNSELIGPMSGTSRIQRLGPWLLDLEQNGLINSRLQMHIWLVFRGLSRF